MNDPFAERVAAVRARFAAKLDARIAVIESSITSQSGRAAGPDILVQAHRNAHDLCGVGPTLGYVGTAKVARSIEQVLLAAVKAERMLNDDEVTFVRDRVVLLKSTAAAEMNSAGQEMAS
jgi:chemotaxis protein histidine kinase CheA